MRHFVAAVLGLVLTPVLLYALGWGTVTAAAAWSNAPGPVTSEGLAAGGVLAVVGAGIVVLIRGLPPLTALIAGVGFVTLNVLDLVAPPAEAMLPRSAGIVQIDWVGTAELLQQNILVMLGVVLVVSALSPARWRVDRTEGPDEDYWSTVRRTLDQDDVHTDHVRRGRPDRPGRHRALPPRAGR